MTVTTTVSLDGLRELAAFRAENGVAISLYVDLDPSVSPTSVLAEIKRTTAPVVQHSGRWTEDWTIR